MSPAAASSPVTVTEIADRYLDDRARLDPVEAVRDGSDLDGTALTDYSPDGWSELARWRRSVLAALDAARAPVDEAERLGARFLRDEGAAELDLIEQGEHTRLPSTIVGPPSSIRMVFDLMDPSGPAGWEPIVRRLEAVPTALAGYRASLAATLERREPASRRLVVALAQQCRTWAGPPSWFDRLARGASAPGALAPVAQAAGAAYGDLADWLLRDYAPRAVDVDGVGSDRYLRWARAMLGTSLDLDDAYAWGVEEWRRIEADKVRECARISPGAPYGEVVAGLSDPASGLVGVEAYRDWLQARTDAATDLVDGTEFDVPPELRRCVASIPPEGSAAAPYYTAPSQDRSRPGRTWWPTLGEQRFPLWDKATVVFHEAVPGHHLQAVAVATAPLTRAHRRAFLSAHGEGWALYAERLMDELGWFDTPETRLGFLCSQAFRAARVVIDIGLHTGRTVPAGMPGAGAPWTVEAAEAALRQAGGLSEAFARSEVLRYLSWPAQATTYKLGERTWLDGRADARRRAGAAFDRKAWHTRALSLGALGLDALADELGRC